MGSSFFNLSCANCKQDLGKIYKSTNQALDDLREYFTLFVDQCNSYQTGSADNSIDHAIQGDRHFLNHQVKHIQEVLVRMNERIAYIEKHIMSESQYSNNNINQSNSSNKGGATAELTSCSDSGRTGEKKRLMVSDDEKTRKKQRTSRRGDHSGGV